LLARDKLHAQVVSQQERDIALHAHGVGEDPVAQKGPGCRTFLKRMPVPGNGVFKAVAQAGEFVRRC